jgi:flagellar biosynthesis/type III secretory pathway ATPase
LDEIAQARRVREAIALLAQTQDARALGLDPGAGDATIRSAIAAEPAIATFLRQTEPCGLTLTLAELGMLADGLSDGYPR